MKETIESQASRELAERLKNIYERLLNIRNKVRNKNVKDSQTMNDSSLPILNFPTDTPSKEPHPAMKQNK